MNPPLRPEEHDAIFARLAMLEQREALLEARMRENRSELLWVLGAISAGLAVTVILLLLQQFGALSQATWESGSPAWWVAISLLGVAMIHRLASTGRQAIERRHARDREILPASVAE
ncbi:MAG: hypothetical protein CMN73_14605 [Sphingomonas sp.]|nr:hypothetical protein [Sphingomonas sp.]